MSEETTTELLRILSTQLAEIKTSIGNIYTKMDSIATQTVLNANNIDHISKDSKVLKTEINAKIIEKTEYAITTAKKDMKLFIYIALLGAIGSIGYTIFSSYIKISVNI